MRKDVLIGLFILSIFIISCAPPQESGGLVPPQQESEAPSEVIEAPSEVIEENEQQIPIETCSPPLLEYEEGNCCTDSNNDGVCDFQSLPDYTNGISAGGKEQSWRAEGCSKSKFCDVVVKAMYDNFYCFDEPVSKCVDVSHPYVRVLNAEDFTETGMISLVVNVGKRIDAELPGVSKGEIMFSFRDRNQKVIKRLYWEEGKWSE